MLDVLEVPSLPNFLRFKGGDTTNQMTFPIHRLSDAEIKELGKEWTKRLLAKARQNRKTHD